MIRKVLTYLAIFAASIVGVALLINFVMAISWADGRWTCPT